MADTTTQTIHLLDCPVCGKPIKLSVTYEVHLDEGIGICDLYSDEKVVKATLRRTGSSVNYHWCPPPKPTEGGV